MKRIGIILVLIVAILGWISSDRGRTAIVGKVNPGDAAEMVWLLGEKDSLKTGLSEGQFYFDTKPGTYRLVVDAKAPYKDAFLENLVVKSEETLDVGEIILKQ